MWNFEPSEFKKQKNKNATSFNEYMECVLCIHMSFGKHEKQRRREKENNVKRGKGGYRGPDIWHVAFRSPRWPKSEMAMIELLTRPRLCRLSFPRPFLSRNT